MIGIEHARRSSARISASFGLQVSVRSPHRTNTSAACEISPNSSRNDCDLSSFTCRSPSEATLSTALVIAPLPYPVDIGHAPLRVGDLVVDAREHAATADLHL